MVYTALWGIAIVLLAASLAAAGAALVQRLVPVQLRKSHNVAIGIIYGGLYILFGVMVGFTAFLVLDKYNAAQETVQNEAGDVEELYEIAERFPEPKRSQIQESVAVYARTVIDDEWPLMGEGLESPSVEALGDALRANLQEIEPKTSAQQALYSRGLETIGDLEESRDVRLLYASEGLPPMLWIAIAVLSLNMMFFSFVIGMESGRLHVAMVSALAAGIVIVLFTIGTLDRPFGTDARVGPEPFELVLREIGESNGR